MVFENCGAVITNRFVICQDTSFAGGKNAKLVFSDNEGNDFKWSLTVLSVMCRTLEFAFWRANALANLSSELVPSLASSL